MAGSLYGQMTLLSFVVETYRLVDDVSIAPFKTVVVTAQPAFDKLGKAVGGDRVGDDLGTGILLQHHGGDQGDEGIAVDGRSVTANEGGAVHIGVEDNAQIGMLFPDGSR